MGAGCPSCGGMEPEARHRAQAGPWAHGVSDSLTPAPTEPAETWLSFVVVVFQPKYSI